MEDLFTLIKLHGMKYGEKVNLIAEYKYLNYFKNDVDPFVSEYARKQIHKEKYKRINAKLKTLGWQSEE